jgi:hypothetical protein
MGRGTVRRHRVDRSIGGGRVARPQRRRRPLIRAGAATVPDIFQTKNFPISWYTGCCHACFNVQCRLCELPHSYGAAGQRNGDAPTGHHSGADSKCDYPCGNASADVRTRRPGPGHTGSLGSQAANSKS